MPRRTNHPGESKTSPRRLEAVDRKLAALDLRKQGLTFARIAEQLGYANASAAHKAVMTALRDTLAEPAEEVRTLELERLDTLLAAHWDRAVGRPADPDAETLEELAGNGPDDKAAMTVLKVLEARRKLLGLDAPTKAEVTGKGGGPVVTAALGQVAAMSDEDLVAAIARLEALVAQPDPEDD